MHINKNSYVCVFSKPCSCQYSPLAANLHVQFYQKFLSVAQLPPLQLSGTCTKRHKGACTMKLMGALTAYLCRFIIFIQPFVYPQKTAIAVMTLSSPHLPLLTLLGSSVSSVLFSETNSNSAFIHSTSVLSLAKCCASLSK